MDDPILRTAGQLQQAHAAREAWRAQAALVIYAALLGAYSPHWWDIDVHQEREMTMAADRAVLAADVLMTRLEQRP